MRRMYINGDQQIKKKPTYIKRDQHMRHMWVSFETTYVLQPETYKKDLCESAGDLQKRAVKRELYTSK